MINTIAATFVLPPPPLTKKDLSLAVPGMPVKGSVSSSQPAPAPSTSTIVAATAVPVLVEEAEEAAAEQVDVLTATAPTGNRARQAKRRKAKQTADTAKENLILLTPLMAYCCVGL